MIDEPVTISAVVTQGMKLALLELGDGNLSHGLRLHMAQPTTTASGANWCDHQGQLPDPADAIAPSVMACDGGVVAHGVGATSLIFDAENSELLLLDGDDDNAIVRPMDLAMLATIGGALLPALLAVINSAGPDRVQLPAGLEVRRLAPGVLSIGSGAMAAALDVRHSLQLAAEVSALLAREVTTRQQAIHGLELSLAAEPAGVAP